MWKKIVAKIRKNVTTWTEVNMWILKLSMLHVCNHLHYEISSHHVPFIYMSHHVSLFGVICAPGAVRHHIKTARFWAFCIACAIAPKELVRVCRELFPTSILKYHVEQMFINKWSRALCYAHIFHMQSSWRSCLCNLFLARNFDQRNRNPAVCYKLHRNSTDIQI